MPEVKIDTTLGTRMQKWREIFSEDRAVADIPFVKDDIQNSARDRSLGSLVEVFLVPDEALPISSIGAARSFFSSVEPDRFIGKSQAVAWLDDRSMTDAEDNTTKNSGHIALPQNRAASKITSLFMELEARMKERLTSYLEVDRRVVYIHHMSDTTLLALTQAPRAAPQRFDLSSYLPCLTLERTGGEHKLTKSDWRSLSWLYRSSGERTGDKSENDRLKPGSEKGALEFLRADASYIDPTNGFEQSLQTALIVSGDNQSKWTSWVFTDPEIIHFEDLEIESEEQEADRKILLLDYDLKAVPWARYRELLNDTQFTGIYRRETIRRHSKPLRRFLAILREHMCRNRHLKLAYTTLLTGAQLTYIVPIQGYDISHGEPSTPQAPPIAGVPSIRLLRQLDLNLNFLTHPSTTLFVFSALAYGAVAMHQYSINEFDRFQQLSLIVGFVVGVWLSSPPFKELGAQRFVSSNLALAVTVALFISAVGHWMYATCWVQEEREESVVIDAIESKAGGEVV
jgi:hypothetical protein